MKKLLSIFVILTIIISSVAVFAAETTATETAKPTITFSDVDDKMAGAEAIKKLVNAGVLNGYTDGTFRPNNPLTRAELCKIINIAFKYTEPAADTFSDVKKDDWFYSQVAIAKKAGYIAGHADGTFKGNDYLTREQACTIITRVAKLYDLSMTETITDAVSEWAVPYVNKVVANRLMSLEEGGKFRATENITRAELTGVVANFVVDTPVAEKPVEDNKKDEPTKEEDKKEENKKPSTGGGGGGGGGGSRPSTPDKEPEEVKPDAGEVKEQISALNGEITEYLKETSKSEENAEFISFMKDVQSILDEVANEEKINDKDYIKNKYGQDILDKYGKLSSSTVSKVDNALLSFESASVLLDLFNTNAGDVQDKVDELLKG